MILDRNTKYADGSGVEIIARDMKVDEQLLECHLATLSNPVRDDSRLTDDCLLK